MRTFTSRTAVSAVALLALAGCADAAAEQPAGPALSRSGVLSVEPPPTGDLVVSVPGAPNPAQKPVPQPPQQPLPPRTPVPAPAGRAMESTGLTGTWSVRDAGAAAGTALVLGPGPQLELRSGTAQQFGTWRASGGVFVAALDGRTPTPAWLTATRATSEGSSVVLHRGTPTALSARLVPAGGQPDPGGIVIHDPAPLPKALRPAADEELLGRWVPADGSGTEAPNRPSVTLEPGGGYTGTDGCNSAQGRWAAGRGGLLLATSGPMTEMGCTGMVGVPTWLGQAHRAGFDGAVLVLVDVAGKELGRLLHLA